MIGSDFVNELDKILEELQVQRVGIGCIDLICPTESIGKFIDKMNELNIHIIGFTWWCHAANTHEACGMGGPKCIYTDGYYSEIQMGYVIEFDNNEEIRNYLLNEYPNSSDYKPCYVPGFWLNI